MTDISVSIIRKSANRAVASAILSFSEDACLIRNIQLTEIDGKLRVIMPLCGENGERNPTVYFSPALSARLEKEIADCWHRSCEALRS